MKSLKLFRKNSFVLWVWLQHVKSPKSYTKNIKGSAPVQKFLTGVFLGPKILPISGVPCRNKSMTGQVIKIYQTFSFFFSTPSFYRKISYSFCEFYSLPNHSVDLLYSKPFSKLPNETQVFRTGFEIYSPFQLLNTSVINFIWVKY